MAQPPSHHFPTIPENKHSLPIDVFCHTIFKIISLISTFTKYIYWVCSCIYVRSKIILLTTKCSLWFVTLYWLPPLLNISSEMWWFLQLQDSHHADLRHRSIKEQLAKQHGSQTVAGKIWRNAHWLRLTMLLRLCEHQCKWGSQHEQGKSKARLQCWHWTFLDRKEELVEQGAMLLTEDTPRYCWQARTTSNSWVGQ